MGDLTNIFHASELSLRVIPERRIAEVISVWCSCAAHPSIDLYFFWQETLFL